MITPATPHSSRHYIWGEVCQGWHYLEDENLSVIREKMPPATSEKLHHHNRAQQFFYILGGEAQFEIDGEIIRVAANEGIHIKPGSNHKISNPGNSDLEFILISSPPAQADRVNVG